MTQEQIRARVLEARARGVNLKHKGKKLLRNHPCPCASGIKFKKCCGRL